MEMKKISLLLGVFLMTVSGCKSKPSAADTSAATPAASPQTTSPRASASEPTPTATNAPASKTAASTGPQFDWEQYDEESFETRPSEGRVFTIPQNAARLRAKFTATTPVDAAAITRDTFKGAKGVVREDRLFRQPCASIGVNRDDAKCLLDPKALSVYVLRDRRAAPNDAVAKLLAKRPDMRNAIVANTAANKVKVTLYVWACVANCGPLGGPAQ